MSWLCCLLWQLGKWVLWGSGRAEDILECSPLRHRLAGCVMRGLAYLTPLRGDSQTQITASRVWEVGTMDQFTAI